MTLLYANDSRYGGFFESAFSGSIDQSSDVRIASAFFTHDNAIINLLSAQPRTVKLLVRLAYPTCPSALKSLIKHPRIQLRYFTSKKFHPKLYLFGEKGAYVGSANLTQHALLSNQEIMLHIGSDDPRLNTLQQLFEDYWDQAEVVSEETLRKYQNVWNKRKAAMAALAEMDSEIEKQIGSVEFSNPTHTHLPKKSKEDSYISNFAKIYQETVAAYRQIEPIYQSVGRKTDINFPLRLEIDGFFSFMRERHAERETWNKTPLGLDEIKLRGVIQEWLNTAWPHFEQTVVTENYPRITSIFGDENSLNTAPLDELVSTLTLLHAFSFQRRYAGGTEALQKSFTQRNGEQKIRSSLTHLLYGKGSIERRMANLVHNSKYKLEMFGQACVQELVGWVNDVNLPVINGRTTKVLRFFGFDVKQLN